MNIKTNSPSQHSFNKTKFKRTKVSKQTYVAHYCTAEQLDSKNYAGPWTLA